MTGCCDEAVMRVDSWALASGDAKCKWGSGREVWVMTLGSTYTRDVTSGVVTLVVHLLP
jgi:hypothetical protein